MHCGNFCNGLKIKQVNKKINQAIMVYWPAGEVRILNVNNKNMHDIKKLNNIITEKIPLDACLKTTYIIIPIIKLNNIVPA